MPYEFKQNLEFPTVIDNSMRSAFVMCPMKYWLQYRQHLQPAKTNPDLFAGGCFAKGIEMARRAFYEEKLSEEASINAGAVAFINEWGLEYDPDSDYTPKTFDATLGAYLDYFREYPMGMDTIQPYINAEGRAGVEFSFAIPIPDVTHPITGEPILWAGRFDMLGEREGSLFVVDEKTTKQLGATWLNQWDLRSQFTGYCWAAKEYGLPVAGAIVRGVRILKARYGHAQVITYRPQWQIDRWLEQVQRDIKRMIVSWEEQHYDMNFDGACTMYSGCQYRSLCTQRNPENWVPGYFHYRPWNPLANDKDNSGIAITEETLASDITG